MPARTLGQPGVEGCDCAHNEGRNREPGAQWSQRHADELAEQLGDAEHDQDGQTDEEGDDDDNEEPDQRAVGRGCVAAAAFVGLLERAIPGEGVGELLVQCGARVGEDGGGIDVTDVACVDELAVGAHERVEPLVERSDLGL